MYVREQPGNNGEYTFAVSGKLWNRSLVMMDRETKTLWSHLLGKAMEGEHEGTVLETVPSTMVDWESWKEDHPETTVLALSRTSREFVKEFHDQPGRFVLGLRSLTAAKSYAVDLLRENPVINDEFEGRPVVVVYRPESAGGRAFLRQQGDRTLHFEEGPDEHIRDRETGSIWDPETGRCEQGQLSGNQLAEIPAIVSFRRAWKVFYPDTDSYSE